MCHYGTMGLEGLRAIFRPKETSDDQRSEALLERISNVFWLLANNPRAFKFSGTSWEVISPEDLENLGEKERKYLGEPGFGIVPWVYAKTEGKEAFVAIGLGAKRVKFSVNGGRPQLIQETRVDVGVWEEGDKRDTQWEYIEKIVSFVEQVPQRRLLNGSGSPQIDGLPGTEV